MGFHGDFLRSKALLGDYTTQYIGDYHKPLWEPLSTRKNGSAEGFEQCSHVQIASLSELLERNIETGTFSLHFGGDFDSIAFAEFPKSTH